MAGKVRFYKDAKKIKIFESDWEKDNEHLLSWLQRAVPIFCRKSKCCEYKPD